MKMKRYIVAGILAAAFLAGGCGKFVRDELITMQNEIDRLYTQVDGMNKDLAALRSIVYAMGANGYIVGVEEGTDEDGRSFYKLKFRTITPDADGRGYEVTDDAYSVTLYTGVDGKNGEDAVPYVVSARQAEEDGRWYWYSTQDEDWLKDDQGNRFSVDGKTPQLKVEEGFWFVSWDGGQTWEETGWKAKGEDAYELFTKAEVFDDRVELTLAADGSALVLPRFLPVDVELTVGGEPLGDEVLIAPGETVSIHYVLQFSPKEAMFTSPSMTGTAAPTSGSSGSPAGRSRSCTARRSMPPLPPARPASRSRSKPISTWMRPASSPKAWNPG